jgi:hypothetical protein
MKEGAYRETKGTEMERNGFRKSGFTGGRHDVPLHILHGERGLGSTNNNNNPQ